jgi:hypothetical protein
MRLASCPIVWRLNQCGRLRVTLDAEPIDAMTASALLAGIVGDSLA